MNSRISQFGSNRPQRSWQKNCPRCEDICRGYCRGEVKTVGEISWHPIDPIVATNSARYGNYVELPSAVGCSLTPSGRTYDHGSKIGRNIPTRPPGPNFARGGRPQKRYFINAPALLVQHFEFESFECSDRLTTVPNTTADSPLFSLSSEQVHFFGTVMEMVKKLRNNTKVNKVLSDLQFGGWQPSRASKEKGEAWENSPRSKDAAHNETPTRGDSRIGVSYGNQY